VNISQLKLRSEKLDDDDDDDDDDNNNNNNNINCHLPGILPKVTSCHYLEVTVVKL
jgi:hypothetical protein